MADLIKRRFVAEVLKEEGETFLKSQEKVLRRFRQRTGRLMSSRDASVDASPEGSDGVLTLTHIIYERFLDIQKSQGKRKKVRGRVHNRYVFGMYGNLVRRLTTEFTEDVIQRLRNETAK